MKKKKGEKEMEATQFFFLSRDWRVKFVVLKMLTAVKAQEQF